MPSPENKTFKVYQASAGSGKTYTIVKEYLKLCLKSRASVANYSQILAITFTNMAANEMKDKVVKQLVSIINSSMEQAPAGMENDLINELIPSDKEMDWDINAIGEIRDAIQAQLVGRGFCTEQEFYPYIEE